MIHRYSRTPTPHHTSPNPNPVVGTAMVARSGSSVFFTALGIVSTWEWSDALMTTGRGNPWSSKEVRQLLMSKKKFDLRHGVKPKPALPIFSQVFIDASQRQPQLSTTHKLTKMSCTPTHVRITATSASWCW